MLAKINIISKLILSPKEIEIIAQEITNQGLEIHDLGDASNYLSTTVFYRGSSLIISVNIPRLIPTTFRKVIIEPIPMSNRTVQISHNSVFINSQEILAINSQCREYNKITICERKQLVDITNNPCEAPLLREQHGQCHLLEKPPSTEIRMIAPGTLLVITVHQDVTINSTCGINTRTLTGIHLVTFHNCSLYVKGELYENFELEFYHPSILPLQPIKFKPQHIDRHVNMSKLHEFSIHNRRYLETVELKHKIGIASISVIITLMFTILAFGFIKYRRLAKTKNCLGQAILKGGRVKHETSPAAPTCTNTDTETAKSATSEVDTSENVEASNIADYVTSGPASLGARLALLGRKAKEDLSLNPNC